MIKQATSKIKPVFPHGGNGREIASRNLFSVEAYELPSYANAKCQTEAATGGVLHEKVFLRLISIKRMKVALP